MNENMEKWILQRSQLENIEFISKQRQASIPKMSTTLTKETHYSDRMVS